MENLEEKLESTTKKRKRDKIDTREPDWMNIPFHLLTDIRYMLTDIKDYIRFGAVCRLWRSSCVQIPNQRPLCAATRQLPLLNLPSDEIREDNLETCSLYNISERRDMSKFKLQPPLNNVCSSEGWLVFIPDGNQSGVILFNPFYPLNNKIELPPLVTCPLPVKKLRMEKAVLSANPATSSDFVMMIIYVYHLERISFFKSGDEDWTHLDFHGIVLEDAIYYKEQFYILDGHEDVHAFDVNLHQVHVHIEEDPPESVWGMRKYLVVCSGDLLLIRNWHDGWIHKDNSTAFEVLKLDAHGHKWLPVNSLGDQALFIGNNSSVAVSSSNFHGCKPNSIYFISERDVGVFHIQEGKIELDDEVETRKNCAMPVWIEPTLQN